MLDDQKKQPPRDYRKYLKSGSRELWSTTFYLILWPGLIAVGLLGLALFIVHKILGFF